MSDTTVVHAWHFVGDRLRDGRPVPPNGEMLRHDWPLILCESGLHAAKRIIDALANAPGDILCWVLCGGEIIYGIDKLVCRERTILWRIDASQLLREFARRCALDVVHMWDAPDVVLDYLRTGDKTKRGAAWDAAWGAVRDAANNAATRDAASASAWAAAWGPARGSSANYTAWGATRGSTMAAAWGAAWDAAAGARDAAAGNNIFVAAVRDATRTRQNNLLTEMVMRAAKERGLS